MKYDYDIAVIGSGSGGLTVSIGLAHAGKKVALIERGLIGGDCTNYGCVPSKALIDIAKHAPKIGIQKALKQVRERRKEIQDEETVEKIESHGMKIIQGFASFKDKNTLLIDGKKEISAEKIVISTGSHPMPYTVVGLDKQDILTNENIFELDEKLEKIVIIGGGYIGCELAESFANLGVEVTMIQRNTRLIPREEPEASDVIQKNFEKKGIKILTNTLVEKVDGKKLILREHSTETITEIPFEKVLVSLGRSPNVTKLALENAGVVFDEKGITVNKHNKTNIKNIFAIGDCVKGNPQFTHWANNEGRGVVRNIIFPYIKADVRKAILPATLYTNIEVARVGKTRTELLEKFTSDDIVTKIMHFDHNDRSKLTKDTIGFVKVHFKRVSGKVLGATIVGSHAGDMLPVFVSAMENKTSAYKLSKMIYPYPTKAELIKRVADSFVIETASNAKNEIKYWLKDNILQIATALIWMILAYTFIRYKTMHGLSVEDIAIGLYNFIKDNPTLGPAIYILFYAIRPIVLFPATFMTFMSGALFGFWGGLVFTLIGENMSAAFAYFLGKIFGKKLLSADGSGGIIEEIKDKADESPFMTILMTRLLFFPFDLVNYASGFLRINFKGFFLATLVGIIPGASVFILAGAAFQNQRLTSFSDAIRNIDTTMLLFAGALFVITLVFAKFLKKWRNKKK